MKKLAILFLTISGLFAACGDDHTHLDAPEVNATITKVDADCDPCDGTDLRLFFEVTHDDELHDVTAFLQQSFDDHDGDYSLALPEKLFEFEEHAHDMTFSHEAFYTIDTANHSTFYLIIAAEDHNGNVGRDTATIHIHE
jgi:hypothetical protein